MGLHVLITNIWLRSRSGTELYVRDLALELQRQGHTAAVYTAALGPIGEELRAAGIPVVTRWSELGLRPDVIHGHHRRETLSALLRFPHTPAIFISHSHTDWHDHPPLHPRIRRYLGVSLLCVERMRHAGVPSDKLGYALNFVDVRRFQPRPPLPERPRRALVFSNYAGDNTQLPAVAEACRQTGLELDVVGQSVGKVIARPEDVLGQYDIIFTKGKAALEAMAVGTAVVVCDFGGVGPMVTAAEFDALRPLNFGFEAMCKPLRAENVLAQIRRYDPADVVRVRELVRARVGLEQAVHALVGVYQDVLEEESSSPTPASVGQTLRQRAALARDTAAERVFIAWCALGQTERDRLTSRPPVRAMKRLARGLLFRQK